MSARNVLGVVEFGAHTTKPDDAVGYPVVRVPMSDRQDDRVHEIWTSTSEVTSGRRGDIVYGHDGTHLFGAIHLRPADRYRDTARAAYVGLLALVSDLGYPHLVRMWNYISDINGVNHEELEVYRDFCQGRAEGFEDATTEVSANLPAATGVGSRGGGVTVYFLAERSGAPVHFENPRQVPAYHYPEAYGPRSPSFARATLLPSSSTLFLSGTASIIGHESVSVGRLDGQCDTMLDNIRLLLDAVSRKSGEVVDLGSANLLKAYVRHPSDVPYVRERLREVFGAEVPIPVFTVNICRKELLVEVEGVFDTASSAPTTDE